MVFVILSSLVVTYLDGSSVQVSGGLSESCLMNGYPDMPLGVWVPMWITS